MARLDLNVDEMTLICACLEHRADALAHDDTTTELALELSLVHLKLLKACRDELQVERLLRDAFNEVG